MNIFAFLYSCGIVNEGTPSPTELNIIFGSFARLTGILRKNYIKFQQKRRHEKCQI